MTQHCRILLVVDHLFASVSIPPPTLVIFHGQYQWRDQPHNYYSLHLASRYNIIPKPSSFLCEELYCIVMVVYCSILQSSLFFSFPTQSLSAARISFVCILNTLECPPHGHFSLSIYVATTEDGRVSNFQHQNEDNIRWYDSIESGM